MNACKMIINSDKISPGSDIAIFIYINKRNMLKIHRYMNHNSDKLIKASSPVIKDFIENHLKMLKREGII